MEGIIFHSRRTTRTLLIILGVLLVLHLIVVFSHLVLHKSVAALTELADLDLEANLPTYFNSLLFFIGAALFFLYGRMEGGRHRWGWLLMAATFCFLGVDEGSQVHEKLILFTQGLMAGTHLEGAARGWLYYAWVVPYLLAIVALLVILWRWFFGLSPQMRNGLVISGAIYVLSAAGLEMAEAKVATSFPWRDPSYYPWLPCEVYKASGCWMYMQPLYILMYTLEELGEMLALILCICTLLRGIEAKGMVLTLGMAKAA